MYIVYLQKISFVAGDVPGTVTVEITTKNGDALGKTQFTYINQEEETMKQIVQSKKLQGQLFRMLGKQCDEDESKENDTQISGEFKLFPLLSLVMSAYRRIFVYNICLISIGHTFFHGTTKIFFLNNY